MPIYAYKCASCGHQQDVLQKMSDDPLTVCPQCNLASYAKQVTAAGFQLKGSGWYVTDFRDNGAKKDSKAADKAEDKAGDKAVEKAGEKAGDKAADGKSAEAKPADTSTVAKTDSAGGTAAGGGTASSSSPAPGTSNPSGGGTPPAP